MSMASLRMMFPASGCTAYMTAVHTTALALQTSLGQSSLCVWPGCAGCYLKSGYTSYVTADPSWTTGALVTGADCSRCLSFGTSFIGPVYP
jgi:hypothetical protein